MPPSPARHKARPNARRPRNTSRSSSMVEAPRVTDGMPEQPERQLESVAARRRIAVLLRIQLREAVGDEVPVGERFGHGVGADPLDWVLSTQGDGKSGPEVERLLPAVQPSERGIDCI